MQKQRFELAKGHGKCKEMMDLILLGLYTTMPPARAMEIRTLQLFDEKNEGPFDRANFEGKNMLIVTLQQAFVLLFQSFKTAKHRPSERIVLEVCIPCVASLCLSNPTPPPSLLPSPSTGKETLG